MDPGLVKYNSTPLPYMCSPFLEVPWRAIGCGDSGTRLTQRVTDMQTNRYKYFRWTARTGWLTVAYVVAFPAFIGYMAIATDVSGIFFPRLLSNVGRVPALERRSD